MNRLHKTSSFLALTFLLAITFFVPTFLFAQINYVPLAPLPGTGAGTTCIPNQTPPDPNCNVDSISTYLPGIFTLAIEIAAALAVIMITIGGIEYIGSESVGSKADGTKKIQNALIGLLLAIGAWVILNTISPNLVSFNLSIKSFAPPPPATGGGGTPPVGGPCTPNPKPYPSPSSPYYATYPCGSAWPSDTSERSSLGPSIHYNYGPTATCALVGDLGCTSVFQIRGGAISGLLWLASNCPGGCAVTITGGTEFWVHTSHGPLTGMVDLHYGGGTSPLDKFIMSGTNTGTTNSCFNTMNSWTLNGAVYALEARSGYTTHWHVCYH